MDRSAWPEMITALHSNGLRTIIVEKLDRPARDLMVQEAAIADLRKHGFTLVWQLMGAVAQYDKSVFIEGFRGI
jgi:DNA invertase Pin-like site-specific DNA recombinase